VRRALPLVALGLAACVGPALQTVSSFKDVANEELVLVGKVKLTPPLMKDEQNLKRVLGISKNTAIVLLDERLQKLEDEPRLADYAGRLEAPLGGTFFVSRKREPFFIRAAMIQLDEQRKAWLPGGLKIPAQPTDKAVYIGTIHYHRDEFFNIVKVTVDDDFDEAEGAFKKRFGGKRALRKALAVAVKK
jgi:hypothetical protein